MSESDYTRQADGSVVYHGPPEAFSQDKASAVSRGLELGSEPAPTGDPTVETASEEKRRPNPPGLEKGVFDGA